MRYARPCLWAFMLALPLWAATMLVWNTPLLLASQALLVMCLLLASLTPVGKTGRVLLALGLVALCAHHLDWLRGLPAFAFDWRFGRAESSNGWGFFYRQLHTFSTWFANCLNWLPRTLPVMALTYCASRLARTLEADPLAQSLRRLAFAPANIYIGGLVGFVATVALCFVAQVPMGVIAALGAVILVVPLVLLALAVWLVRLMLALFELSKQIPDAPAWKVLLAGYPLALLAAFLSYHPAWPGMYSGNTEPVASVKLPQCKDLRVDWFRLDGPYALEVGRMTCSRAAGSLTVSATQHTELENRVSSVRAGQVWLFHDDGRYAKGEGYSADRDQRNCYDDFLTRGRRAEPQQLLAVKPGDLAWVAQKQATEKLDLGKCLAWEVGPQESQGIAVTLWVQWPQKPTDEQVLRRCQMEAFRYTFQGPKSVSLHVGVGASESEWKPVRSVSYGLMPLKKRQPGPRLSELQCYLLADCPSRPLTTMLLRQQAFYSRRPAPRRAIAVESLKLCQRRQGVLLQALMQYHRDHKGRWPQSPWEVVPGYLNTFLTCPLNESRDYKYSVDGAKDSCRLDCGQNHDIPLQEGQGPFVDSRSGRGRYTHSEPEPDPELAECLKHPRGWLRKFELTTEMQP